MLSLHPSDWKPSSLTKLKYSATKEIGSTHSRTNKIVVFLKRKEKVRFVVAEVNLKKTKKKWYYTCMSESKDSEAVWECPDNDWQLKPLGGIQ